MIATIAKLIIAAPKLLNLFIKIQNEIVQNFKDQRFTDNAARIDEWVSNPDRDSGKPRSGVSGPGGESPPKPPTVD